MEKIDLYKSISISFPKIDSLNFRIPNPMGYNMQFSLPHIYMHYLFYTGFIYSSYLILKSTWNIFGSIYYKFKSYFNANKYLNSEYTDTK